MERCSPLLGRRRKPRAEMSLQNTKAQDFSRDPKNSRCASRAAGRRGARPGWRERVWRHRALPRRPDPDSPFQLRSAAQLGGTSSSPAHRPPKRSREERGPAQRPATGWARGCRGRGLAQGKAVQIRASRPARDVQIQKLKFRDFQSLVETSRRQAGAVGSSTSPCRPWGVSGWHPSGLAEAPIPNADVPQRSEPGCPSTFHAGAGPTSPARGRFPPQRGLPIPQGCPGAPHHHPAQRGTAQDSTWASPSPLGAGHPPDHPAETSSAARKTAGTGEPFTALAKGAQQHRTLQGSIGTNSALPPLPARNKRLYPEPIRKVPSHTARRPRRFSRAAPGCCLPSSPHQHPILLHARRRPFPVPKERYWQTLCIYGN